MTSWANSNRIPLKKSEPTIRSYFSSPSDDYAVATLGFVYSYMFCQRSAEAFYVQDTQGYIQPLLTNSPVIHFIKDSPSEATNMAMDPGAFAPVLNQVSITSMKRTISSLLQYNGATNYKVDTFLNNFGTLRQTFDVGIVLDISGSVSTIVAGLKTLQKRIGKKTLKIFAMTDDVGLLRQFATSGDPSWTYISLLRNNTPITKDYLLTKTLAELKIMQQIDYLAFRFGSPLGKLLFLTSSKVNTESQVISVDNQRWKAI